MVYIVEMYNIPLWVAVLETEVDAYIGDIFYRQLSLAA
jgi:hypothetical protein